MKTTWMRTRNKARTVALALAAGLFCTSSWVQAQAYPDAGKTLTIIVPFAAGGPTDKVARDFAESLRKSLKVGSIVVENVGGAGGTIGATKAARAKPDGYTVLLHHIGMAISSAFYGKLPYNVASDFEYLGIINDVPMTLVGKPKLQANNYPELMQWVTTHSDKINMGHAGEASASHLCGLMLQKAWGVSLTTVPYKGAGPAMTDLIGNQIDIMCDQTTNTTGQISGKTIKGFAVTTPKRLSTPALKGLPTLDEEGLKGFNVTIWHGLYAPKGTPPDALKALNAGLKAALKDPEFQSRTAALGAVLATGARTEPTGHRAFVQSEIVRWTPVITSASNYR